MRQLLLAIAGTIIGVIILVAIGYGLFAYQDQKYAEQVTTQAGSDPCSSDPRGVDVLEHRQIAGVNQIAIAGVVVNNSATAWRDVVVHAKLKVENTQVNECESNLHGPLPPRSKRPFLVECSKVTAGDPVQILQYQVMVTEACREVG